MIFRFFELIFVFFSKIYISVYKERGDNWRILPIVILSTILLINIQVLLLFFFHMDVIILILIMLFFLLVFNILFKKINYSIVVNYPISRKQKIIISSILIIDFIIVIILLNISRSIYIANHPIS